MSGFNEVSTSFGRRSEPTRKPKSYFPQTIVPTKGVYYDRANSILVTSGSGPILVEFESGSGYVNIGGNAGAATAGETIHLDLQPVAFSGSTDMGVTEGRVLFYYKGQSG